MAALESQGVAVHSVLRVGVVLEVLERRGVLTQEAVARVRAFLATGQTQVARVPGLRERQGLATNPMARRILAIVLEKKSNLCVALDCSGQEEVLLLLLHS